MYKEKTDHLFTEDIIFYDDDPCDASEIDDTKRGFLQKEQELD